MHTRVPLVLPATLILPSHEFACLVTDISGGGAGLQYPDGAPRGEVLAQLSIDEFGTFDGITVCHGGDSRGLRFLHGEAERNQLLVKLTLYVEEGLADVSQHGRWPAESKLSLTRTSGLCERCEVIRISLKGVCLVTEQRPPLHELVKLGRMYGRVSEHLADGILIRFLSFVQPKANA
jgi:hypothetical protein